MRSIFSDGKRIQRKAKASVEGDDSILVRWWCTKYKLPSNHPMLLSLSESELSQQMYEDLYSRKFELEDMIENGSQVGESKENMESLASINKILGETENVIDGDPLIDKWERELEEGKVPDLDEEI